MFKAHGFGQITGDGPLLGVPREFDTFQCAHCHRHTRLDAHQRATDVGGYCSQCDRAVCRECAAKRDCFPIEKLLEKIEKEAAIREWF